MHKNKGAKKGKGEKRLSQAQNGDEGVLSEARKYQRALYGEWSKKTLFPFFTFAEQTYHEAYPRRGYASISRCHRQHPCSLFRTQSRRKPCISSTAMRLYIIRFFKKRVYHRPRRGAYIISTKCCINPCHHVSSPNLAQKVRIDIGEIFFAKVSTKSAKTSPNNK